MVLQPEANYRYRLARGFLEEARQDEELKRQRAFFSPLQMDNLHIIPFFAEIFGDKSAMALISLSFAA